MIVGGNVSKRVGDGRMLYRNQYTVAVGAGTFSRNIFSGRRAADAAAKNILG